MNLHRTFRVTLTTSLRREVLRSESTFLSNSFSHFGGTKSFRAPGGFHQLPAFCFDSLSRDGVGGFSSPERKWSTMKRSTADQQVPKSDYMLSFSLSMMLKNSAKWRCVQCLGVKLLWFFNSLSKFCFRKRREERKKIMFFN